MKYRRLRFRCQCGAIVSMIRRVELTSDHQLGLTWRCNTCKKPGTAVVPLSECWRNCPQAGEAATAQSKDDEEADRRFLRSVGIESA